MANVNGGAPAAVAFFFLFGKHIGKQGRPVAPHSPDCDQQRLWVGVIVRLVCVERRQCLCFNKSFKSLLFVLVALTQSDVRVRDTVGPGLVNKC